jgi:hypothetical protein
VPCLTYLGLFDYSLGYGFINYYFGIGVFLLIFALWCHGTAWPHWRRLLLFAACTTVLYFCHFIAGIAYGLVVGGYEAWRLRADRRSIGRGEIAARLAVLAGQFLPFLALTLYAAIPRQAWGGILYVWLGKLQVFLAPFLFFRDAFELRTFLCILALAIVLRRRLRLAPQFHLPALALVLGAIAMPTGLAGTWFGDARLGTALWPLAIAALSLDVPSRRMRTALAGAAAAFFLAHVFVLSQSFVGYGRMFEELRTAARETLPPGSRVLPAKQNYENIGGIAPTDQFEVFANAVPLLLLDQPLYVPILFAAEGRQPLWVEPPNKAVHLPFGGPMPDRLLRESVSPESGPALRRYGTPTPWERWAGWPAHFDSVVMLDFGDATNPLPGLLEVRRRGSFFTIYAVVRRTGSDAAGG